MSRPTAGAGAGIAAAAAVTAVATSADAPRDQTFLDYLPHWQRMS
jgi:hypothetical protein